MINILKEYKSINIVLIGFMGSGKSTIARKLAEKLDIGYVDVDEYIVRKAKMTIPDIFSEYGEGKFREIESECFGEILRNNEFNIIATGGGLPINARNQELITEKTTVIYLKSDMETIYNRTKNSNDRPLLNNSGSYSDFLDKNGELYEARTGIYEELADYIVESNNNDVDEICERIIEWMKCYRLG